MDFMLDIETLDTRQSSIVLSIGFVAFDKSGPLDRFYAHLKTDEQERHGRTLSVGTVEFWMQHKPAYPDKDRRDVEDVLLSLRRFVDTTTPDGATHVWAKPPSFDLMILESLFKTFMVNVPWNYRVPRCVRTMQDLLTDEEAIEIANAHTGVAHNALDDCLVQIAIVNKARSKCQP